MSSCAAETSAEAYSATIEETFVRLRGAPYLLTPLAWKLVRHWYRQGVPLDVVRRTLEEVSFHRRQRGSPGRISSLQYFAAAVQAAWSGR
ncbi:MAG TPA: hypothetical protein VOA80_13400 [Thermoanaerobaculia bacterium]|nr:hypothetical protein [Thermoanaerobaculia bacterium]